MWDDEYEWGDLRSKMIRSEIEISTEIMIRTRKKPIILWI